MHPGQIASRKAVAQNRSKEAVRSLSEKFNLGIDPGVLTPTNRDGLVLDMLKAEAFADVLEALNEKLKPAIVITESPEPSEKPSSSRRGK